LGQAGIKRHCGDEVFIEANNKRLALSLPKPAQHLENMHFKATEFIRPR
jgi:hypothetical protein